jgi:phosphate acetyltransferase
VTPGDRADIILGCKLMNLQIILRFQVVLTGNIVPDDSILLIEGLTSIVPIISVEGGTYNITNKIGDIKRRSMLIISRK